MRRPPSIVPPLFLCRPPRSLLGCFPVIGWLADFFRFVWGLPYWNIRKTWFQLRRGRSASPCQSRSDSGRAYETACDACLSWEKPARFRRICPLLVHTPHGLRCSVDAANVRPFWGRAVGIYAGSFAALYLGGALTIFVFLRTVGYPTNLAHLVWPGAWHRVTEARGWFFMDRANRAFDDGQIAAGMLYLGNAYEFDPANYTIASTFAHRLHLSHPVRANEVYRRLRDDHPAQRAAVSELWFRSLLAHGDFETIATLARDELFADPSHTGVWMRALIFATRQTHSDAPLLELASSASPAAQPWLPLLETELLLRSARTVEARAALVQPWENVPAYSRFYQIDELIALGEGIAASDFVARYRPSLDDTARAILLLDAYASIPAPHSRQRLAAALLQPPLTAPTLRLLAAHLIRYPDAELFAKLYDTFAPAPPPLTDENLDAYLALYCTAGLHRDWPRMQAIGALLQQAGNGSRATLSIAARFFQSDTQSRSIASILPALPLPLEVQYALHERFPSRRAKSLQLSAAP